jgi:protein-disulfide isomerase
VKDLKKYAADLKLDTAKFDTCLDSGKQAQEIAKDMAEGSRVGVTGTPAFFINGRLLSGAQPFSAFQEVIDDALAAQ